MLPGHWVKIINTLIYLHLTILLGLFSVDAWTFLIFLFLKVSSIDRYSFVVSKLNIFFNLKSIIFVYEHLSSLVYM